MIRHSKFQVKDGDTFKGVLQHLEVVVSVSEGIYSLEGTLDGRRLPTHVFESAYEADLTIYTLLHLKNTIRKVD